MESYTIYSMQDRIGTTMKAISNEELAMFQPEDYFPSYCTDLHRIGDIEIGGPDANYVPDSFKIS